MTDDDFRMTEAIDKFSVSKHNETDFSAFQAFSANLDNRYGSFTQKKAAAERRSNLQKWDQQLAYPWNQARLSDLHDTRAAAQARGILASKSWGSFYVTGAPASGKTFLALAIARRYIGSGLLLPSQVKHVSEGRLLTNLRSGFKGQEVMNEIFAPQYRLYVLDNVGSKNSYDEREESMWELLLDHVIMNNLAVIFTSAHSLASFTDRLSGPAQAKVINLVHDRTIAMNNIVTPKGAGKLSDKEQEAEDSLVEVYSKAKDFDTKPRRRK